MKHGITKCLNANSVQDAATVKETVNAVHAVLVSGTWIYKGKTMKNKNTFDYLSILKKRLEIFNAHPSKLTHDDLNNARNDVIANFRGYDDEKDDSYYELLRKSETKILDYYKEK